MDVVQQYGLTTEESYSKQGRTAEDGALAKGLFYNIAWQSWMLAAISLVDTTNCNNNIAHPLRH